MILLLSFVVCGVLGAFIAQEAQFTKRPLLWGAVIGGVLHFVGCAILLVIWVIKSARGTPTGRE